MENLGDDPATVLPLLCCCKNRNLKLADGSPAYEFLLNQLEKNVLFSLLPNSREESDDLDFLSEYVNNLDCHYGGYFVLRHVISELANNVYDHSQFGDFNVQSYIFSSLNESFKKLDIAVIDDGLSIPGLFEICNVDFENDCHALSKSIELFSTVSNDYYERGNGLRTIVRLIAEGNVGEMLIVSRNAALLIQGEDYNYYLLDEKDKFNGTLVSIRLNKYEVQDVYSLLEPQNVNFYKYKGHIHDY